MSRAARAVRSDPPRSSRDVRTTLDSIADEILAQLENVLALGDRQGMATVIISGDAPMASARDAHGWSTRIVEASRIVDPRKR